MYHVDITNAGDSIFKVKSANYEFTVDTKGNGITPPDTLLASLGTCIGVYIRKYAEGLKLEIEEFSISVSADFAEDKPVRFKDIKVLIDLKGLELDEARKNGLLRFIQNCPVHNTIENSPSINIELK